MNDDEKCLFDLTGYLVIEAVLAPEDVAVANEAIDRHQALGRIRPPEESLDGDSPTLRGDKGRGELGECSTGKNRGVTLFEKCWFTRELFPTLMNCSAEDFGWITRYFCCLWTKERRALFFMAPRGQILIRISITSTATGRCIVG